METFLVPKLAKFDQAVSFIFQEEGGYVHDPHDPGGETNFGISKRAYPHLNIRDLTRGEASRIYFRDYWKPIRGEELPFDVAMVMLNAAVMSGPVTAIRLLQDATNNKIDGVLGPKTLGAIDEFTAENLVVAHSSYLLRIPGERYDRGWIARLIRLSWEAALSGDRD